MLEEYTGAYHDKSGDEAVVIRNDGQELTMTLRGVEFAGGDTMGMQPLDKTDRPELAAFTFYRYPSEAVDLCACIIEYTMPLPIVDHGGMTTGLLTVHANLGEPVGRGGLDREDLRLTLTVDGDTYEGSGRSGWFEDELLEIQKALPDGVYIKACINCAYSDYSVYGHHIFGSMRCFRRCKATYLAVRNKRDYMNLQCAAMVRVQETYLCPEFARRTPGTGYRG